jgi:hypothetical protein
MGIKSAKRKGAIELSLGFIVTVVFAVVLLSLAIVWIRGMIGTVGTLTDDLTQKAHDTLSETFNSGKSNFAVFPREYTIAPGNSVKLSLGVKNDDKDGQPHNFVVRVYPAMASSGIVNSYGCTSGFAACDRLNKDMMSWVTYSGEIYKIQPNVFRFWDVSIALPNNVVKGVYQFDLVACEDSTGTCDRTSTNWGTALSLQITAQ